jgi:hypothetical protein
LPKGKPVQFVLLDSLSTATARKGQIVHFAVAQDVKQGEAVVIPRGTPAIGEVKFVRKSIPDKQGAYLDLEPAIIVFANGTKLKVAPSPDQENCEVEPSCWVAIGWMAAVEAVFLPIDLTALAIHSTRHKHNPNRYPVGEDFERGPCETIPAYTARNWAISSAFSPPSASTTDATLKTLDACLAHSNEKS